jgi:hypothetical protein
MAKETKNSRGKFSPRPHCEPKSNAHGMGKLPVAPFLMQFVDSDGQTVQQSQKNRGFLSTI